MLHFATLFDINYLSRGLALLDSLKKHSSSQLKLFVLCLDKETENFFKKNEFEHVVTINLNSIESWKNELAVSRENRTLVEYYFTLSPALPLYILENFKEIDFITTLDADIVFYDDPNLVFNSFKNHSILITPHRFSEKRKHLEVHGKYNVSFQSFRNDETGNQCLKWWLEKCIHWCKDEMDLKNNRYADQKYLDEFELIYGEKVKVLTEIGAGLAPWNIDNYTIGYNDSKLFVNSEPLIFYHFHHFRIYSKTIFITGVDFYGAITPSLVFDKLFLPYFNLLIGQSNSNEKNIRYGSKGSSLKLLIKNNDYVLLKLNNAFSININKGLLLRKFLALFS